MQNPDYGAGVTIYHPVLSLLQQWIDPADPLNFASVIGRPLADHLPKHVLQTFGIGDHYSPEVTLATFAAAAGLEQVTHHSSADPPYEVDDELPAEVELGLSGNVTVGTAKVTLGMRQYGSLNGSDGHFVVFDPPANADMLLFVTGAVGATPPVIGQ